MDPDLSERYNDGLAPPPDLAGGLAPAQVGRPAWKPTVAQVEMARRQLAVSLLVLLFLIGLCAAVLTLLGGLG